MAALSRDPSSVLGSWASRLALVPNAVIPNLRCYRRYGHGMFGCHSTAGSETGPLLGESTYGVELSLAQSKPVPIKLVILDRTLKYVGGVYSNLDGAVASRLDLTL